MAQQQATDLMTEEEFEELMRYRPVLDWEPYIETDPNIAHGKPVVRGTRLSAEFILELYAGGLSNKEVLENYPNLRLEDIRAVFAFAAQCVSEKQVPPTNSPASE
jgi:uncharacterized protein (DUF433 family)